jgi:hypothetical protein
MNIGKHTNVKEETTVLLLSIYKQKLDAYHKCTNLRFYKDPKNLTDNQLKRQELKHKEAQTLGGEIASLKRALIELGLSSYLLDRFATEIQQRETGEAEADEFP